MPEHGEAIIAIGNFSNSATRAVLTFSNGDTDEISIAPFGTRLIRKAREAFRSDAHGGMTIKAEGSPNLIASGVVSSDHGTFTSSIRFYDTENTAQANLYTTNFRLKNVRPKMVLRNTSDRPIAVTPRFIPSPGDPNDFIDLPSLSIEPNEIKDVDFEQLQGIRTNTMPEANRPHLISYTFLFSFDLLNRTQ